MKITYIMMQYPLPTQTFAISDIASLAAQGHDVTVECLLPPSRAQRRLIDTYDLEPKRIRNSGVRSYLTGLPLSAKLIVQNLSFFSELFRKLSSRPQRLIAFIALLPRLAQLTANLAGDPPDVVHAFWGHWPSVVPALLKRYAPNVIASMSMGAYDLYAGFPLRLTANRVDTCFTHSESNLAAIEAAGCRRSVRAIHRGIPIAELHSLDDDGNLIQKEPLMFCTASALVKEKQVDVSLRVFSRIKNDLPQATLVVVGDGPERRALEELAKELGVDSSVTFAGYQKRQDLFKIMCRSSYFLFFSTKASERLPNVVKEAMLAKCVCFVSNTQGIDELIPNESYGLVFPDLDVDSIAKRIRTVVANPERCARIGNKAHGRIVESFSSDAAMRRYLDAWSSARS